MENINISQSVAILCDGNNIERSIHEASKSKYTILFSAKEILLIAKKINTIINFLEIY